MNTGLLTILIILFFASSTTAYRSVFDDYVKNHQQNIQKDDIIVVYGNHGEYV